MNDHLTKIYTQLFAELNYTQNSIIPNFFFNTEKNSFYCCSIINETENEAPVEKWMSEQKNIFQTVMEKQGNPQRVKNNTTHLVFYLTENENNNFVYELEEDEYYFKKNVITLNYKEISDFEEHFKDSKYTTYKEFLENTVDNNELFKDYKISQKNNYYSMILKFYIKIPSLYVYKSVSTSNLKTLTEKVEDQLKEIKLLDFKDSVIKDIDSYIEKKSEQDLELKDFDVESVLDKWIGEFDYGK